MEKKIRSFAIVSLILISIISVMGLSVAGIYHIATATMYQRVNLVILVVVVALLLLASLVILGMYMVYIGMSNWLFNYFAKKGMRVLFPIYEMFASVFGLKKDEIRWFYIRLNNIIIDKNYKKFLKEDILIILPHCIQNADCELKVTGDINICKKCGKCSIKDVTEVTEEFGLNALIVTGGTAARNAVKKYKPKFIFSVACERDLSAGITDVSTIPVMGIVNKRPNGPCYNTSFDVEELRAAIIRFVEKDAK